MMDMQYLISASEKLGSGSEEIRYQTVKDLCHIHSIGAIPLLMDAIGDSSYRIRENALKGICSFPSQIIFPRLESCLRNNDNANIRTVAIEAFPKYGKEAVPCLLGLLNDFDEEIRMFSASILGEIADPSSVEMLLKALNDPDDNVKHAAVESLGKIRDPLAVEPLINCLNEDFWIQYPAVVALGNIGDSRSIEPLLDIISDELLRQAIIEAIGKIGDISAVPVLATLLLQRDQSVRNDVIAALIGIQSKAQRYVVTDGTCLPSIRNALNNEELVEHLMSSLDNPDHEVKKEAIIALGWLKRKEAIKKLIQHLSNYELEEYVVASLASIGKDAFPELLINLDNPDPKIRVSLLRCIGLIDDADCVRACIPLLSDSNIEVRYNTVLAMGRVLEYEDVEKALLSMIQDENPDIRLALVNVLGKSHSANLVFKLGELLNSGDSGIKLSVVKILGRIKIVSSCKSLEMLLEDNNDAIRSEAYRALGLMLPAEEINDLLGKGIFDASPQVRKAAISSLVHSNNNEIEKSFLLMLDDSDPGVRLAALDALGMRGNPLILKGLISVYDNAEKLLKLSIIKTLSNLDDRECINFLTDLLKEADSDIRRTAVESLGKICDQRFLPNLIIALDDSDWSVRAAAISALGKIGDKRCVPYIISKLHEDDNIIRKCAIAALGDLNCEEAINHILPFIHNSILQQDVVEAVQNIGVRDLKYFSDFFNKANTRIKCVLVEIIGKSGNYDSVDFLVAILNNEFYTVRCVAARALGELGDKRALHKLVKALKDDPIEEVRREAALALKRLDAIK